MNTTQSLTVGQIQDAIHHWAPAHLAESYDNVGLLVGDSTATATGILVALEMTEAVLDEALATGCNAIVCHHPIWFGKRLKMTDEDWVGRLMLRAARQGIHLLAAHTNLDNVPTGVNRKIGDRLGLTNLRILQPNSTWTQKGDGADTQFGSGMIGEFAEPLGKQAFFDHVKQTFGCAVLRYADAPVTYIRTVAYCGGSGSFLLTNAMRAGADAFLTGDVTHHKFFDAENRLLFIDMGHWESEQFTSELIVDYLSQIFPNFAVRLSSTRTNPVSYHL